MAKSSKKYARAIGTGVERKLNLRNRLLAQTFDYVFERTDNQLSTLVNYPGAGEELKKLKELLDEQHSSLEKSVAQLKIMAHENGVKPSFTGKGFEKYVTALTPYSRRYVETFEMMDDSASYLYAMWVAGLVEDEAWREQIKKLRSRAHAASQAVDAVYRRIVKRMDDEGSEKTGDHDQDESAAKQEEATPASAEADAPEDSEDALVETTSEGDSSNAATEAEDAPITPDEDSEPAQEEQEKDVAEPIDGAERKPGGLRGLFGASAA